MHNCKLMEQNTINSAASPADRPLGMLLQWLLEAGALPKLLALLQDADGACRRKALLAISCLVRQSPPAMTAFRLSSGVPRLIAAGSDADPRLARSVTISVTCHSHSKHVCLAILCMPQATIFCIRACAVLRYDNGLGHVLLDSS